MGTYLKNLITLDNFDFVVEKLGLKNILNKDIEKGEISGGELQSVSIAAALLKDVDLYFFDEPSSYLDIYQRLKVARIIKELSEKKKVLVIEHDLAVLDFLCDNVHLMYGDEGAYGVVTHPTWSTSCNKYVSIRISKRRKYKIWRKNRIFCSILQSKDNR